MIDVAYHGSTAPELLERTVKPMASGSLAVVVDWDDYDAWMDGGPHLEDGLPYANYVIEAAGMAPGNEGARPEWSARFPDVKGCSQVIATVFRCMAFEMRSVIPDIDDMAYHRTQIESVISGNPAVAAKIWGICRVSNY